VLSTFVFSPIDWLAKYGRRPMSEVERRDWFLYWNEFGRRMGISGLFDTIDQFHAFAQDYERRHFVHTPTNRLIAERTIDLVLSRYFVPRALQPAARHVVLAICDPPLVSALGFPEPPSLMRRIADGALRMRRAILRRLPANRSPNWLSIGKKTYPDGYNIEELGTFPRAGAKDAR
jgi:hypothetical protein